MIELRWLDRRGSREHFANGGPDVVLQFRLFSHSTFDGEFYQAHWCNWQDVPTVNLLVAPSAGGEEK